MPHNYNLARFLTAQDPTYSRVLTELRAGEKRSHWMWFIFPQIAGLGHSQMSQTYAIASLDEARAYLAHPVLGARLRECTTIVNAHAVTGRTIHQIFGGSISQSVDGMKFHSSVTLFARATEDNNEVFTDALDKYFGGQLNQNTVELLVP